jgi:tRNA (adenine37-N6)-methyltransferase
MGKIKRDKCEGAELKAPKNDGVMEEVTPNPERPEILSPLRGSTISGQGSDRHPKVFIKTFGWPMSTL